MQGTNVLFGQIAVVIGIVIAGVWDTMDSSDGYQVRLGSPWFDLLGVPVYHPWRLFEWWFFFDAYAPHVFDTGGAIAGVAVCSLYSSPSPCRYGVLGSRGWLRLMVRHAGPMPSTSAKLD